MILCSEGHMVLNSGLPVTFGQARCLQSVHIPVHPYPPCSGDQPQGPAPVWSGCAGPSSMFSLSFQQLVCHILSSNTFF